MENQASKVSQTQQKNQKTNRRLLGPVANLEEHVRPDWWRAIFNSLYLKTDGDVVDDRAITGIEVDTFVGAAHLMQHDHILDVCCGQGRHSLELARRGFSNVEGFDRSHYLIQRAKASAKKEGLDVRFREGDARKLPYAPDSFDAVLVLGNSFGYFETVHDDLAVLKEIRRVLKPRGRLLIDVADGEYLKKNYNPRSWEWIGEKHFVCRERSLSTDESRLISREIITHIEKGLIADQFYAERLYNHESLAALLKEAGFTDIACTSEIQTESQRNQDLGMMAKRLVMTCTIKKEWTPTKKPKEGAIAVTVLLGDSSKPDIIKPCAVFDEDDLYTIDQLKGALKECAPYHFTYYSNHGTLIGDLAKQRGKTDIVLNLCDEGFNNDPRKELHVPALLEILDIPYTGAGPQCLAYCYDKSLVRGVASEMDIPVPKAFFIKPEDASFELQLDFPVIAKPNFGDSSFGITERSVAYTVEGLVSAITEIRERFGYEKPILIEEFLTGKDLSVGIIGNPPESYTVLPITEEDYSALPPELPRVCGYEAKWLPDSPYWKIKSIPADLPEETKRNLVDWCLRLFERLECRDYCRFDWRLDGQGQPKLLEVNPNPGWCWDGHLAKMAKIADMSYTDVLHAILKTATARITPPQREENGAAVQK